MPYNNSCDIGVERSKICVSSFIGNPYVLKFMFLIIQLLNIFYTLVLVRVLFEKRWFRSMISTAKKKVKVY